MKFKNIIKQNLIFFGVYSKNSSSKMKHRTYIINLDEYESIGTHWIALYVNSENVPYFGSLGVEHIPKEIRNVIENKNITTNTYRLQACNSIIWWWWWWWWWWWCDELFCGMVDRRKVFSFISRCDHCQRFSPLRISNTPRTGFEPAQNPNSGLMEWSCEVVITTFALHLLASC